MEEISRTSITWVWRVSGLFFAGLVSWEMTNLMPGHVTSGSYRNKFTSCEHPVNCYKFQNTGLGLLIFLAGLHRADLGTCSLQHCGVCSIYCNSMYCNIAMNTRGSSRFGPTDRILLIASSVALLVSKKCIVRCF